MESKSEKQSWQQSFNEKTSLKSSFNQHQAYEGAKMGGHSIWRIGLIVCTIVVYAATVALNGLAGTGGAPGVFNQTTGDISDHYLLQVTPAGWTFSIWGIIYTWQALWLIYGLTTICRKKDGTYFYLLPLMPVAVYFSFMFNNICNVAWLFTWDMEEMVAALPLIALMPFSLYIGLYFSFSSVYRNLAESTKKGLSRDIWLIRLLVQNGIAFYATWVTIATLLNLAIVMSYWGDVSVEDSGTTVLSILLVEVIIWFVTDIFIFDKYVRYTFSPYITLIMALSGVLSKNYDLDNTYRNSVFTLFNLVLCIILFVFKLVTLFWRHFRSPINPQMV